MADAYWRYGQARQPQQQSIPTLVGKRSRSDYDVLGGHELHNYYPRDDDRGALRTARDSDSIGASYDRYLRSGPISSYSGGQSARPISGVPSRPVDDLRAVGIGSLDPGATVKERTLGLGSGRPEAALPPDASSTLFVEGLPSDCTRREVAHIFRPFVGYKEVRLVSKESRRPGGDPLVLCFVDFLSPAHAATALDALQATGLSIREKIFPRVMDDVETKASLLSDPSLWRHIKPTSPIPLLHCLSYSGYKFDEHDRDLVHLRLQFARYPGARSGGGHRGKR